MHSASGSHGDDPVYGITTAEESHTDDISRRQRQYVYTMLFRVVAIIVVVVVPGISWLLKVLLCVVATIIPYVAVIRANGGPPLPKDPTNLLLTAPAKDAVEGGREGLPAGARVWQGEWDTAGENRPGSDESAQDNQHPETDANPADQPD